MATAAEQLMAYLRRLEDLNPEVSLSDLCQADEWAKEAGGSVFTEAAAQTAKLIDLYLDSQTKKQGAEVLEEYFHCLSEDAQRLLEAGEISAPVQTTADNRTTALVPRQMNTALDRCIVLNRGTVPSLLAKAADAFRRRNEIVNTVMELAFRVLWKLDAKQADDWFVAYFKSHEGNLDPDFIRDALTIALTQPSVSKEFLEWTCRWCGDFGLLEHWPTVVYKGDRLLCRHGIRAWLAAHPPRTTSLAHLQLMFKTGKIGDEAMLAWAESALGNLGECVLRIMELSKTMADSQEQDRFRGALLSELRRLSSLFPAILLAADQILCRPNGPVTFAMALMGLAGQGLEQWDNALLEFCRRVIRRTFIFDMRAGRSPKETIERLTFGDKNAFLFATAQLDLVTEKFDSIKQREMVIEILAPFYASYRQAPLLAAETTRRYRKLRWLLHEDYLRQALTAEQFEQVKAMDAVWEISALAGDARKFLGLQRNLQSQLEIILASKIEFEETIREHRLRLIRKILSNEM